LIEYAIHYLINLGSIDLIPDTGDVNPLST
jgi:hypothetical protein